MSPLNEWSCWEIIQCDRSADCPASRHGDIPCWEMAKELDDYRSALNICKDCIVFVSRQRDSVLSEEDIQNIMAAKTDCVLKTRCVQFVSGK
jgi:hypothetical protein